MKSYISFSLFFLVIFVVMGGALSWAQETRFCACHKEGPPPPEGPKDVHEICADLSSLDAHLKHGDGIGGCDECGNEIVQCCTFEFIGDTKVATECCDLTSKTIEECQAEVPGCEAEECDDGNSDCNDGCDSNCRVTDCDDENDCTADSCEGDGACAHEPVDDGTSCDDASACTENDSCQEGSCVGGSKDCDDSDVCTDDSCDSSTGCVHDPVACIDDNNACTACEPEVGCASASCGDGEICTVDTCDAATGCVNADRGCDDDNPETTDSCDPETGCVHDETPGAGGPPTGGEALVGTGCGLVSYSSSISAGGAYLLTLLALTGIALARKRRRKAVP